MIKTPCDNFKRIITLPVVPENDTEEKEKKIYLIVQFTQYSTPLNFPSALLDIISIYLKTFITNTNAVTTMKIDMWNLQVKLRDRWLQVFNTIY